MTLKLWCEICENTFDGKDYSEICDNCEHEVNTIVDEFCFEDMWAEVNSTI